MPIPTSEVGYPSIPVAGVLSRTLDEFGVPQREKDEVLGAFAAHKPEVTEGALATASR
jgi:hemoglobin